MWIGRWLYQYLDSRKTHWTVSKHHSRDGLGSYIEWIDFAKRYQMMRVPRKWQILFMVTGGLLPCARAVRLTRYSCNDHSTYAVRQYTWGYHITFFSMDRSNSSLATLLQRQISELKVCIQCDSRSRTLFENINGIHKIRFSQSTQSLSHLLSSL